MGINAHKISTTKDGTKLAQTGGKKLLLKTTREGATCLHMASQFGHINAVQALSQSLGIGLTPILFLTPGPGGGWVRCHPVHDAQAHQGEGLLLRLTAIPHRLRQPPRQIAPGIFEGTGVYRVG